MSNNVVIIGSNTSQIIGTLGTNGTLSEEIDLGLYNTVGLLSDGMANGTMNILVSVQPLLLNGTLQNTYRLLRDNAGVAVAYTIPTGSSAFKESDMHIIAPYRYVRFLSSVNQSGASFTAVVKG